MVTTDAYKAQASSFSPSYFAPSTPTDRGLYSSSLYYEPSSSCSGACIVGTIGALMTILLALWLDKLLLCHSFNNLDLPFFTCRRWLWRRHFLLWHRCHSLRCWHDFCYDEAFFLGYSLRSFSNSSRNNRNRTNAYGVTTSNSAAMSSSIYCLDDEGGVKSGDFPLTGLQIPPCPGLKLQVRA